MHSTAASWPKPSKAVKRARELTVEITSKALERSNYRGGDGRRQARRNHILLGKHVGGGPLTSPDQKKKNRDSDVRNSEDRKGGRHR